MYNILIHIFYQHVHYTTYLYYQTTSSIHPD
nr:MAG TPA: hypothetical protein [Caudoviricetes sp.]